MSYFFTFMFFVEVYIILALGLNIMSGYAGQLSLGHSGFTALGAYTSSILLKYFFSAGDVGVPFFPFFLFVIIGAVLIGVAFSFLLSLISMRVRGDYFLMTTIGFSEILRNLFSRSNFFGGSLGIKNIPNFTFYNIPILDGLLAPVLPLLIALGCYLICSRIERSEFGLALRTVREDELLCQTQGLQPWLLKFKAIAIGGSFATIAGVMLAPYYTYIDPNFFSLDESIFIFCILTVGGLGSKNGAILGSIILTLVLSMTLFFDGKSGPFCQLIYGLLMIVIAISCPDGLLRKLFNEK